jgi:hypothetical protein
VATAARAALGPSAALVALARPVRRAQKPVTQAVTAVPVVLLATAGLAGPVELRVWVAEVQPVVRQVSTRTAAMPVPLATAALVGPVLQARLVRMEPPLAKRVLRVWTGELAVQVATAVPVARAVRLAVIAPRPVLIPWAALAAPAAQGASGAMVARVSRGPKA